MLSPSDNLKESLIDLQLCTDQQLHACEPEVRRLAGDLPGFDSCWLDVLVGHRLLTPWQAECLQSDNPFTMRQGPYRLREPLGQRTWQAETFDRNRLVVMTHLADQNSSATEQLADRATSMLAAVEESRAKVPSAICLPREYLPDEHGNGGWMLSPYVPGWQLDELLIRGGRLPWQVVVELGRALLLGMDGLQRGELNHGDISLRNIRLQPNGQPVLVDPFTARLLKPTVGFRADLRLREILHCAPELAGAGRRHGTVSDLYSLGTVLWQLLTARPTFISADPVTYLMQCRERDVEDVRHWVPDCPDELAYQIQQLTRRRPELRPQTTTTALESWNQLPSGGSAATRRLLKRLPDRSRVSVAPQPTLNRRRLWKHGWAAAAVTGCVMVGLSSSLIPMPLNLSRTAVTDATIDESANVEVDRELPLVATNDILPLPTPSPDGVIQLVGGQRYEARSLQQPGAVHIRTPGDSIAVVVVADNLPWKISADQIQLNGIHVRSVNDHAESELPLLDLRCGVLELDRMIIGERTNRRATGFHWMPLAAGSSLVRVMNTVFLSGRYAIRTTSAPDHFVQQNVLFEKVETAWRCDTGNRKRIQLNMNQVTQRGGSSFADVICGGAGSSLQIDLTCGESVLTPAEALVRLASTQAEWTPQNVNVAFRLPQRANPTIIRPSSVNPVVWFDRSLKQRVALPDNQILSESLLMAEPEFDSSASGLSSFGSARLVDFDGPKRGQQLPGVDVTQLPVLPSFPEETGDD